MTDRNTDDTYFEFDDQEPGRRAKKLPRPLIRLILLAVALVLLIVIIVVSTRSCSGGDDTADYAGYMSELEEILAQSDSVGADLAMLLTAPGDTNRAEVQARLDEFITTSEELEVRANTLAAPKDLVEAGIHQILLLVMDFRETGVTALKPAVMNALEVEDTEVPAEQILHALYYLTNSDFMYKEVFLPRAADLLAEKKMTGVSVPSSRFLEDPDLASRAEVLNILTGLRSAGVLTPVHGVALKKVVAMPDDKEITAGGTFNLTASDSLQFLVTVENQGNMDETDVKVVITLTPSDSTQQPQEASYEIQQIKAKTETEVTIEGLNPTAYGEIALIDIEVVPVENEKYSANNSLEAKVIFKI